MDIDFNNLKYNIKPEWYSFQHEIGTGWVLYEERIHLNEFLEYLSCSDEQIDSIANCSRWKKVDSFYTAKEIINKVRDYIDKSIEDSFYSKYSVFLLACEIGEFTLPKTREFRKTDKSLLNIELEKFEPKDKFDNIKHLYQSCEKLNLKINTHYTINTFGEFMSMCLLEIFKNNRIVKKCENCGLYFVPKRNTAIWCDRISPQDKNKTCKDYGSAKSYEDSLEENEAKRLRRKIYLRLKQACRRQPSHKPYQINFDNFMTEADKFEEAIAKKEKTTQEYITWLKKQ